jgi:SOS-response transcriptional repressor LexA
MASTFRVSAQMRSRKIAALDFIKQYFARWGCSPSHSEIGAALGATRQRARELVEALARERLILVVPGQTRGIRLPDRRDEISVADAVLRLRQHPPCDQADLAGQAGQAGQAGAVRIAAALPLSYLPLSAEPDLDYQPIVETEAGANDNPS